MAGREELVLRHAATVGSQLVRGASVAQANRGGQHQTVVCEAKEQAGCSRAVGEGAGAPGAERAGRGVMGQTLVLERLVGQVAAAWTGERAIQPPAQIPRLYSRIMADRGGQMLAGAEQASLAAMARQVAAQRNLQGQTVLQTQNHRALRA